MSGTQRPTRMPETSKQPQVELGKFWRDLFTPFLFDFLKNLSTIHIYEWTQQMVKDKKAEGKN